MSLYNEVMAEIHSISKAVTENFNHDFEAVLKRFEAAKNAKKTGEGDESHTLQSIAEDGEVPSTSHGSSMESSSETRMSRTRRKRHVDSASVSEINKLPKRKCHIKAISNISQQANTNLIQKMRRDDTGKESRGGRRVDKENLLPTADDEEMGLVDPTTNDNLVNPTTKNDNLLVNTTTNDEANLLVIPTVEIKREKISLPEPKDTEPLNNVNIEENTVKEEFVMPPSPTSAPKRGRPAQKKLKDNKEESESTQTRTRKTRNMMPPQLCEPVPSARSIRANARASAMAAKRAELSSTTGDTEKASRPKRTRAKRQISDPHSSSPGSPNETSRRKLTRKGQKKVNKQMEKSEEPEPETTTRNEEIVCPESSNNPVLPIQESSKTNTKKNKLKKPINKNKVNKNDKEKHDSEKMDQENIIDDINVTVNLPNSVYNHAPVTPKCVTPAITVNTPVAPEIVVSATTSNILDKTYCTAMDATVVITKDVNELSDNSLLTDDCSDPEEQEKFLELISAVKEKVQQFEELATKTTRTKTRAMAKTQEEQDKLKLPVKKTKPVLSPGTLNKMDSMIFGNRKCSQPKSTSKQQVPPAQPPVSASTSKPQSTSKQQVPPAQPTVSASTSKPQSTFKLQMPPAQPTVSASISKPQSTSKQQVPLAQPTVSGSTSKREAAIVALEEANKKREALLEAKREQHKKKREEKIAAAAAAREAAERERQLAMQAAIRERKEKEAMAVLCKLGRLKDYERKKQELALKMAEREERWKAKQAREQKLAEEQKRAANAMREKQLGEAQATKKESAKITKEINEKYKAYIDKKKQERLEDNKPQLTNVAAAIVKIPPVCMVDGFQYLHTDEDEDEDEDMPENHPWNRLVDRRAVANQGLMPLDQLLTMFAVRELSPSLLEIFPDIDRKRLKRTSSAVWLTPPKKDESSYPHSD